MTIAQEEIFGPVLVVIPFEDDDDAVRIANDSPYGLSGMITSGDLERAKAVARRIRTGTLGINGGIWYGADAPFGGYKRSGIGRQCGIEGLEIFTETKTVGWPTAWTPPHTRERREPKPRTPKRGPEPGSRISPSGGVCGPSGGGRQQQRARPHPAPPPGAPRPRSRRPAAWREHGETPPRPTARGKPTVPPPDQPGRAGDLTNYLPPVRRKLKIDTDDIRARNPNIIIARGSGQGPKGPDAEKGGYDGAAFWARGGVGITMPESARAGRRASPHRRSVT